MNIEVAGLVWLPLAGMPPSAVAALKKTLTIIPKKAKGFDDTVKSTPIPCWIEQDGRIGIPRWYFATTASGDHKIDWTFSEGSSTTYESLLTQDGPYAEQAEVASFIVDRFRSFDGTRHTLENLGGIIKATTGFGKTNTALEIAYRLRTTTMILTHRESLMKQWKKRIHQVFPDAKVGIVRGPRCKFVGMDFVIAMLPSLSPDEGEALKYPDALYSWAGFLVIDEVHRVGAPTWAPVPMLITAKYRLGLSATPRRRDNADKVFWWHIGPIVYTAKTETPKPGVRVMKLDYRGPDILHDNEAPKATVTKMLGKMRHRNRIIISETYKAATSANARKVMILAESLDHLRALALEFSLVCAREGAEISTGYYTGQWFTGEMVDVTDKDTGRTKRVEKRKDLNDENYKNAERAQVIFATYKMCAEGLDIPAIDTVIFAVPISDIEQAAGRPRRYCLPDEAYAKCDHYCPWRSRKCEGKPTPVLLDLVDVRVPLAVARFGYRNEFYESAELRMAEVKP